MKTLLTLNTYELESVDTSVNEVAKVADDFVSMESLPEPFDGQGFVELFLLTVPEGAIDGDDDGITHTLEKRPIGIMKISDIEKALKKFMAGE